MICPGGRLKIIKEYISKCQIVSMSSVSAKRSRPNYKLISGKAPKVRSKKSRAVVSRLKRAMLRPSRNCHAFKRWGNVERYDCSAAANLGAMVFSLSDIVGYAEFEALYDRYMITCVVLRFRIINNPNATWPLNTGTANNATNWFPRLFYCPDYDDNSAESVATLRERSGTKMKILKPNQYIKVVVKPACTIQTYYTTTGAGYAPKWKQWIDMGQSGVPHYGLKWAVDCSNVDPSDTYPFKFEIEKQYYFKCKDVK